MAPPGAAPQALDTRAADTPDLAPALQSPRGGGRRSRTSVDLSAEARALLSERFGGFLAAQAGVTVGLVRCAAARAASMHPPRGRSRARLVRSSRVGRNARRPCRQPGLSRSGPSGLPTGSWFGSTFYTRHVR